MITTKKEILDLISKNSNQFKKFGVKKIGLFGSYVRNNQNINSDVDLLIDFDKAKKSYKNYISMINFTENILGKSIDVITPQSLSPYIGPHIEKEIEYVQIN